MKETIKTRLSELQVNRICIIFSLIFLKTHVVFLRKVVGQAWIPGVL